MASAETGGSSALDLEGESMKEVRLAEAAPNPATGVRPGAEGWYIVTDFFDHGGKVYADLGPFESRDLALTVRTYVEASPGPKGRGQTFCVDHWPHGWNHDG